MDFVFLITILMFLTGQIGFVSLALFLFLYGYLGFIPIIILMLLFYSGWIPVITQGFQSGSAIRTLELAREHQRRRNSTS